MCRENVVTQTAQRFDDGLREILVGVEPQQDSGVLVLANLALDLVPVRTHKGPRIGEILGSKRWVGAENIRVAHPEAAILLQGTNRDTGAHDARIATANTGRALDSGECIAKLANYRLKNLGLLCRCHLGE